MDSRVEKVQMLEKDTAEMGSKEINGGIPPEIKESSLASATQEEDTSTAFNPRKFIWHAVVKFTFLHFAAVYGLYVAATLIMWKTIFFALIVHVLSLIGILAGYHRLFSHRSYKAKLPLKILLLLLGTMSYQESAYWWARNHRIHHKYTETNADPYNVKRGLFYSHIGWLLVKKHPDVYEKGNTIDLSDLHADPVVMFQHKYYNFIAGFFSILIPALVPKMLWGENFWNSFFVAGILRLAVSLHSMFLVNSFAHKYGYRPYTKQSEARDNEVVNFWILGEGFHNYHHAFPWDYAASEFGTYFNLCTAFLNVMAWCGLAYDLRTVPKDTIRIRKEKMLNGSHQLTKPLESKFN